ncbi:MAG: MarR family transcriptional regulator, partial [Acidaminobacteraceae bacterium]
MAEEGIDLRVVNIEENLRLVCGKVKNKGREILSDYDITPPQFNALLTLIEHDGLTIGELSNKMYLACSTVTDLLDRMERNELVVRVRDEKDRRI